MEVTHSGAAGGSLQISSEVIEKIARLSALEIDGVAEVTVGGNVAKTLLNRLAPQSPVLVEIKDQVADITINLIVRYGAKIPEVSEKVQQNIKASVQSMTQITVARVNVVVTGVTPEEPQSAPVVEEEAPATEE